MNSPAMKSFHSLLAVFLATVGLVARAALTESVTQEVNRVIPDIPESGTGDSIIYTNGVLGVVPGSVWNKVTVRLQTAGGYNGDLYVLLEHGTNYAILLNRPGRTAARDAGYGDAGLNVLFDDTALNGDIHAYRSVLHPQGGVLTGAWRPDGRDVDFEVALDTDPRTALLSGLVEGSPDGEWSLTVIDAASGDEGTLVSWGLDFLYTAPAEIAVHGGSTTAAPELSSGQSAPVGFGGTAIGVPVSRDFTVANPGNDGLVLAGISVPPGFLALGLPPFPFTLRAGASRTFTVVLTAEAGGVAAGNLVVRSSDSDEATFTVPLSGAVDGTAPQIVTCATNRTLVMSGPNGPALPDLTAEVVATDAEPGALSLTQSPPAGTILAAGDISVAITVSDAAGNQTVCLAVVSVVRLPVAGPDFGETVVDVPTAFRADRLVANDSDPDGTPLSLGGVDTASFQGGVVSLSAGLVSYSPPPGFVGSDTFRYTLVAGGRTVTGLVTVRVRASTLIPSNVVYLRPAALPGTGMEMRFSGLPGRSYSVQFSTALTGPWNEQVRLTALAGSGFIDFTHATAPSGSGFYRCLPAQ